MKFLKKFGLVLLILFVLLIGAAFAIPVLFKDKITTFAKENINNNIEAIVDFEEVNLSFFRSFPNLSFRLQNFSVTGKNEFEGISLMTGENLDVAVDLPSVLKTPIVIKSIQLDKPDINVYVLEDGKANYDIVATTEEETTSSSSDFVVELQYYGIEEGRIHYDDKTLGLVTTLENINHSGKGNFTTDIFDLDTETEIGYTSLNFDGIKYLDSATVKLDAIFNADLPSQKYTLKDNKLFVNALQLNADGYVQLEETGDNIGIDLTFNAPANDFKELLSLLPNAYSEDFGKVRADGTFLFNGFARGIYNAAKEQYPAFELNLKVEDGDLKYPDLPVGINEINTIAKVSNSGGSLDQTFVDVERFAMLVGKDPVEGYLKLKTPLSDPNIDTRIKANLDLANFSKAYPMEGVRELAGKIIADITAKARQSDIERENYANVNIAGKAEMQDILYVADGLPNINVKDALANFTPQHIDIVKFDARLGKSDLYASGKIFNPLAVLSSTQTLRGAMSVRSNYFNADEWLTEGESTTTSTSSSPKIDQKIADQYNFDIDAEMRKIDYDVYQLTDLRTNANVTANDLKLNSFFTRINGSDLTATGNATNLYNFIFNGGVMRGAFDLNANVFNLDQLMAVPESANTDENAVATIGSVPDFRYNLEVNVNANKVIYEPYDLTNMKGTAKVTEKQIDLTTFSTNIADGDISGSGTIANYMEYAMIGDTVRGTFNLQSNFLNLNSILASEEYTSNIGDTTPETAQPEDLEAFILDKGWDFKFAANLKRVLYTDLKLDNLKGNIIIKDGRLLFEDTKGETLGGTVAVVGGYDTQNPEEPKFDMKLDLQEIGVAEAFNTFNTFEKFAPIGGFIQGKMNTTLVLSSVLGQDMMPDLKTLNMEGFIQTFNATIKNFKPFQEIGNTLQVTGINFDEFNIQDTKNWFTIDNGTIKLEEAKLNFKDIQMDISGQSSLENDMDFNIIAVIPKQYIGSAANKGLSLLEGKAQQAGLNLSTGSHIKMRINLSGSMTSPKIGITPLGTQGSTSLAEGAKENVKEEVDAVKEDLKKEVDDKIAETKKEAEEKVEAVVDSVKIVAQARIDSIRNEATRKAEETVGEKAEEIKDKLDKYNPFKKKKKGGGE